MNKSELYAALVKKTGFSKKDTEVYTDTFLKTITEALQRGDKVQMVGFGSFEVKRSMNYNHLYLSINDGE